MNTEYAVIVMPQAEDQLLEITTYISKVLRAPDTARQILDLLLEEILSLSHFPYRFPLTEEEPWHSRAIHKMTVKHYFVYFRIDDSARIIQILAVIYGRRDQYQQLSEMDI